MHLGGLRGPTAIGAREQMICVSQIWAPYARPELRASPVRMMMR